MTREEAITLINSAKLMLINPTTNEPISDLYTALEMAISALEQITQIRKAIVEAEEENLHLSYPVWCFMRKIEKIVGEKKMGEFEQEPCDDAVSLEAVIEWLKDKDIIKLSSQEETARRELKALPSVTQKSGKWINKDVRKEEYVLTGKCSVCGQVRVIDKYCANCGCHMVEPRESEEQTE